MPAMLPIAHSSDYFDMSVGAKSRLFPLAFPVTLKRECITQRIKLALVNSPLLSLHDEGNLALNRDLIAHAMNDGVRVPDG
jgi:hypothetical protein